MTNAPSRVRANVMANYLGRVWTTLVVLLCLPIFLLLLGREAYGLIGAFAVVQAWALLLDFGLTPTLNREIARARGDAQKWPRVAGLLRSVEIVALAIAIVITIALGLAAAPLSTSWLRSQDLSAAQVQHAIVWMGALAAVRWIEQVYRGAIQGSEDQVWLSGAVVVVETLRWVGGLAIVRFVAPDVMLFFAWNFVVALGSAMVLRRRIYAFLRRQGVGSVRIDFAALRDVRSFAGGMFLSSLLTFLLTQADKLVVGRYTTLADFGLYTLAGTAAAGLLQLVQPLTIAILPRFTALIAAERPDDLRNAFRAASQWMAVVVVPVGATVFCLPERALLAWTGQAAVADTAAPVLAMLMMASLLNALANIPYMLQLAYGWTSLTNILNALLLLLMIPAMLWAAKEYGSVGAAIVLAVSNFVSLAILSWMVLSRLLADERLRWAGQAVVLPLVIAVGLALGSRLLLPPTAGRLESLAELGTVFAGIALTILLAMPHPRRTVLARFGVTR